MIGINGLEAIVLCLLAVLVLGPERLPEYASGLARIVRGARQLTAGAQEQLRGELGDDITDVDWRKLDPRQYDPLRIVREALLEDFTEPTGTPAATTGNPPVHTTTSTKGFS